MGAQVHHYFLPRNQKGQNPAEMQEQQPDENIGVTWEHTAAPTVYRHMTALVTPMGSRAQVLEYLKNIEENATAPSAIHSLAPSVSEECLGQKILLVLIIYSPIFLT